ncbi:MAG: M43 family zinc metalloprotease, partial [Saprospiraceae bacterium]
MNKFFFSLLCLLSFLSKVWTQPIERCGTVEYVRESLEKNPELLQQYLEVQRYTKEYQRTHNGPEAATVITIPVVVNVVYKTPEQNISDEQIFSQIEALNKDFRKLNIEIGGTPPEFAPVVSDVQIEFCLARRDPDGNPTTGIRRRETDVESFPKGNAMKSFATGGLDAWDRDRYLNIWVCRLSGTLLGFAPYPGSSSAEFDGVVCTYTAFGTMGTATFPFDKGRTATHEIGHWLNLIHIWGDEYCGDDEVADTPQHNDPNYGCIDYPHQSECAGMPNEMTMNYMDYSDDRCMYMFSGGQKVRMRAIVEPGGFRQSLATSDGCVPVNCISGNISWEHNGNGVNNVTVNITGPDNASGSTAISGDYELCMEADGTYTITPSKPHANVAQLLNGVTAADVLRIQQHVSNTMPLLGPFKRIAADVNANNLISSQDASILSQAIKGNPAAQAQIPKSWRFVPVSHVFTNPLSPWGYPQSIVAYVDTETPDQDFVGIKIGDVNGSANP